MGTPQKKTNAPLVISNGFDAFSGAIFSVLSSLILVNSLGFSGWQLGFLNSFPILLYLLINIPIGRFVDSYRQDRLLVGALLINVLALVGFFWLLWADLLSFTSVLVLTTITAISGVVTENAQFEISAKIQRKTKGSTLVSRLVAMDRLAAVAAPFVIALTVEDAGYSVGAAITIATAVIALMAVLPVRVPASIIETEEESARDMLSSLKLIFKSKAVLLAVASVGMGNLGLALGDTAVTLLLLRGVGMSESTYSLILTISAIVGVIAALTSTHVVKRFSYFTLVTVTLWFQVAAVAFVNLIPIFPEYAFWFSIAESVLWAFAVINLNVNAMDYFARAMPESQLASAMSAMRTCIMLFVPLGAVMGGLFVDLFGYQTPLVIWLVLVVVLASWSTVLKFGRRTESR